MTQKTRLVKRKAGIVKWDQSRKEVELYVPVSRLGDVPITEQESWLM